MRSSKPTILKPLRSLGTYDSTESRAGWGGGLVAVVCGRGPSLRSPPMTDRPDENRLFWETEAANWLAWARTPGHDAYWDYAPAFFRDIVPDPSGRTLEIACGEGRASRDLSAHGHDVYSIDGAPTLIRAAAE